MKQRTKIRHKGSQLTAVLILGIASVLTVFPFLLLVLSSFTDEQVLMVNGYSIFPEKWSLDAYLYIFQSANSILKSYGLSIVVTVIGTIVSMVITSLMAYPLSRKDLKGRTFFTFFVFFTMLFNGGLVSQYMLWSTILQIKNTIFAYLVPNLMMSAFNVMIMKNFFANNVPFEIIESAKIDGSGEWNTFFKIVLPMSTPILAAVGLLVSLAYWNDWMNGLYYINNPKMYTFQNLLNRMIQQVDFLSSSDANYLGGRIIKLPSVSVRMAIASLGVLPVMMIYPFFQKYFAKGLTIGAVKG